MKRWRYQAGDGVSLHVSEVGEGRGLILLHGYFSDAETNWIKYGHATVLAQAGFRVIMPDLRAHGSSDKPHEAAAYPKDILADDLLALITELGLSEYDLGGYSLGARTVSRMLVKGAVPQRVIISGMGLDGLTNTGRRAAHFGGHPRPALDDEGVGRHRSRNHQSAGHKGGEPGQREKPCHTTRISASSLNGP